nr:hypothetical protein [Borrelia persica]
MSTLRKLKETVEGIKNKFDQIVADMKREENPNAAGSREYG